MATVTLTNRGQLTLPKIVRDFLHAKPGDTLDVSVDVEGRVVVRCAGEAVTPTRDIRELRGLLQHPGRRPVTLAQMEAAIARQHRTRT